MNTATLTQSRKLTPDELEAFGRELDALREEVARDLGERDVTHMRSVMKTAARTEAAGRALLHFGLGPITFLAGAASLGVSKILNNMEIGHNVMHGQYDWTRDPDLNGHAFDWDNVCPAADWRHFHNYEHHTYTNVLGRDRDIGYSFLRVTPEQSWNITHLAQPISATWLMFNFQWGVAMHDLRIGESIAVGDFKALWDRSREFRSKVSWQLAKDYVFYPALALFNAPRVAMGNLVANGLRNVWTFSVIFCGHFPDGVSVFTDAETQNETRGAWYLRQARGSANIEGSRAFHVLTGHLSHQIEHHLFPDIPASRYPEMAPRVRDIMARYGQVYNTGSFARQLGSVAKRIAKFSLPPRVTQALAA